MGQRKEKFVCSENEQLFKWAKFNLFIINRLASKEETCSIYEHVLYLHAIWTLLVLNAKAEGSSRINELKKVSVFVGKEPSCKKITVKYGEEGSRIEELAERKEGRIERGYQLRLCLFILL